MSKLFLNVKVNNIYSYEAPAYGYNSDYETHYIYNMLGDDGNCYVWKTTKVMRVGSDVRDCTSREDKKVYPGDHLFLMGTFKCNSEYKGNPQIIINRVQVKERMFAAKTPLEIIEDQINSIRYCDKIKRISYREYKEKYPNNETILDSYDVVNKTIEVIFRDYESQEEVL